MISNTLEARCEQYMFMQQLVQDCALVMLFFIHIYDWIV